METAITTIHIPMQTWQAFEFSRRRTTMIGSELSRSIFAIGHLPITAIEDEKIVGFDRRDASIEFGIREFRGKDFAILHVRFSKPIHETLAWKGWLSGAEKSPQGANLWKLTWPGFDYLLLIGEFLLEIVTPEHLQKD